MSVASDYAAYLKAPALYATATAPAAATWPGGVSLRRDSSMATVAGGQAEASRQAAFYGGNTVRDVAVVPGRKAYLLGKAIVGRVARLGYDAGVPVFVIGVEERADGTTALTVLRKLA